jgi:hypothetical protein
LDTVARDKFPGKAGPSLHFARGRFHGAEFFKRFADQPVVPWCI